MPAGLGAFLLFANNLQPRVEGTAAVFVPAIGLAGAGTEKMQAVGGLNLLVGVSGAAAERFTSSGAVELTPARVDGAGLESDIQPAFGTGAVELGVEVVTGYGYVQNPYVAPAHQWAQQMERAAYMRWSAGGTTGGTVVWATGSPVTKPSDPWVQRAASLLSILVPGSKVAPKE